MGMDRGFCGVDRPQFGPQRFDMGIDGTIQALFRLGPNDIHQLLAGEHPARRLQQGFQQQEFIAGQRQRLLVVADRGPLFIQAEGTKMIERRLLQALLFV
ncbi:hypothetical protein D3C78_1713870 [compost metagenome]